MYNTGLVICRYWEQGLTLSVLHMHLSFVQASYSTKKYFFVRPYWKCYVVALFLINFYQYFHHTANKYFFSCLNRKINIFLPCLIRNVMLYFYFLLCCTFISYKFLSIFVSHSFLQKSLQLSTLTVVPLENLVRKE